MKYTPELEIEVEKKRKEVAERNGLRPSFVFALIVPTDPEDNDVAVGYLKWPGRTAISIGMSIQDRDPIKAKEIVLAAAWLEGDERILKDEYTMVNACTGLDDIINMRQAIIKKNIPSGLLMNETDTTKNEK